MEDFISNEEMDHVGESLHGDMRFHANEEFDDYHIELTELDFDE